MESLEEKNLAEKIQSIQHERSESPDRLASLSRKKIIFIRLLLLMPLLLVIAGIYLVNLPPDLLSTLLFIIFCLLLILLGVFIYSLMLQSRNKR